MSFAIKVEDLAKRYRVRASDGAAYRTLREDLTSAASAPWCWIKGERRGASQDFWALRDVDFEVQPGEAVGVIGRNGAGKSTLLKILSRITKPTSGRVQMRGRVGSLLEVGTGFHPELTGRENIFLSGAILGMSRAETARKFDAIVAFAEIERFLDTPVKRYSSGMYVRLAFSVAAHLEPDILIIDEVLAVGDAAFQKKCLGRMRDVAGGGRTVVFVTHNMTAARSLCSQAVFLEHGQLVTAGPVDTTIDRYLHSGSETNPRATWADLDSAPGGCDIRLHEVSVASCGTDVAPITRHAPIEIAVEYCNTTASAQMLNVSIVLTNEDGIAVFNSVSEPTLVDPGMVYNRCEVPAELLNDGRYRLRVLVVRDTSVVLVDVHDVVMFEVIDSERRASGWMDRYIGIIRPKLVWTTQPRPLTCAS